MLPKVTFTRLRDQLSNFEALFSHVGQEQWERKPSPEKWSARENLAHLGRYHEVLLDRVRKILEEDGPEFARYRAELDREWRSWSSLPLQLVQQRLRELRNELITLLETLKEPQLERTGSHPILGELSIPQWLEFFLLHEAHHLYAILLELRAPL